MATLPSYFSADRIEQTRDLALSLGLAVPENAPPLETLDALHDQLYLNNALPETEERQLLLGVASQGVGWMLVENSEELERGIAYLELSTLANFLGDNPTARARTHAALAKIFHLLGQDARADEEFIAAGNALRFSGEQDTWTEYTTYPVGSAERDTAILGIDVIDPHLLALREQEARRQLVQEAREQAELEKQAEQDRQQAEEAAFREDELRRRAEAQLQEEAELQRQQEALQQHADPDELAASRELFTSGLADRERAPDPETQPDLVPQPAAALQRAAELSAAIIDTDSLAEAERLVDQLLDHAASIVDQTARRRVLRDTADELLQQEGPELLAVRIYDALGAAYRRDNDLPAQVEGLLVTAAAMRATNQVEHLREAFNRAQQATQMAGALDSYPLIARSHAELAVLYLLANLPDKAVEKLQPLVVEAQLSKLRQTEEIRESAKVSVLLAKCWAERAATEGSDTYLQHMSNSNTAFTLATEQFQRINEPHGIDAARQEFGI